MINYRITHFDKEKGLITISYEDYEPVGFYAPIKEGKYLSGPEFDIWAETNFYANLSVWKLPALKYSELANSAWIESNINPEAFPVTHYTDDGES